jgi:hypothetical protein
MTAAPYYRTQPDPARNGRWLVVHTIPGLAGAIAVDADCPTQAAAEHEAAWLEAERTAAGHWHRHEAQLAGVRL